MDTDGYQKFIDMLNDVIEPLSKGPHQYSSLLEKIGNDTYCKAPQEMQLKFAISSDAPSIAQFASYYFFIPLYFM